MINAIRMFFRKPFFSNERNLIVIYITSCILISLKIVFLETCDNYDCFKAAHFHLINNLDIYLSYPQEYNTEYNYSPFFAFLMGVFAYLPNGGAILLWNLVNTIPFLIAIHLLPIVHKKKIFLYWFCMIEYFTNVENVQTNATVTAFIMLVFIYQQRSKTGWSSLMLVFGAFFKIYVLTAGVFFLCYKNRGSFALKAIGWALLLFLLPMLVISFDQLLFLHESWYHRLQVQSLRISLSLIGIIGKFKQINIAQEWIILTGTLSMLLVLFKKAVYTILQFRLLYLASILLFTVLFNPGVESPTYIIAVAGAALWYINKERSVWHWWVLALVFVFTCLSPTELFPRSIKNNIFIPYQVKAIPCIIVWFICMYELFFYKQAISDSTVKHIS